jgi:hypothetical protein
MPEESDQVSAPTRLDALSSAADLNAPTSALAFVHTPASQLIA